MRLLTDLVLILAAARAVAEIAERLGLPAVPFEIAVGVLLGPSALGAVQAGGTLRALATLGAIVLLFEVGIGMDVDDLVRARWTCARVALVGVVASMGLGYLAVRATGLARGTGALLIAAAIAPTSVGISARVFRDLRALDRREARIVLGAGVIDDVAGLLILAVVLHQSGKPAWVTALIAIGFLAGAAVIGAFVVARAFDWLERRSRVGRSLLVPALILAFGLARASDAAGLSPIVGAFVAGLALVRARAREDIARTVVPVGEFLTPIFFVLIGIDARIGVFGQGKVLALGALLLVAAVIGKLVAGAAAKGDRLIVGAGMMPRGEVTLIFASSGLAAGTIGREGFGALVAVVLATAIVAPLLLRFRLRPGVS
jgi:Kef-type K+ transport system membrane component KefB